MGDNSTCEAGFGQFSKDIETNLRVESSSLIAELISMPEAVDIFSNDSNIQSENILLEIPQDNATYIHSVTDNTHGKKRFFPTPDPTIGVIAELEEKYRYSEQLQTVQNCVPQARSPSSENIPLFSSSRRITVLMTPRELVSYGLQFEKVQNRAESKSRKSVSQKAAQ
ncbi:hypothetical protein CBL_20824 [Carabus blaptoides fortunei]